MKTSSACEGFFGLAIFWKGSSWALDVVQTHPGLKVDLSSDYLAELTALPQFGISEIESSVPLPGPFDTHEDPSDGSLASLYFLACISMRRLLNRGHHLLFDKDTGAILDDDRLPGMIDELNNQLTQWKELLPPTLQFSIDTQPVQSQHGAFLRQRFLVCKA